MTRAQEIERMARAWLDAEKLWTGDSGDDDRVHGAKAAMAHALALPAEGEEPKLETWREPFLPVELEDRSATESLREWHMRALQALAAQLGVPNDFYYPLLGTIQLLEETRTDRDGVIEAREQIAAMIERDATSAEAENLTLRPSYLHAIVKTIRAINDGALRTAPAQDATAKIVAAPNGKLPRQPAYFTYEDDEHAGHLYYFAPVDRSPGPYTNQRIVEAIIDIADDGSFAGVELIDNLPSLRGEHLKEKP